MGSFPCLLGTIKDVERSTAIGLVCDRCKVSIDGTGYRCLDCPDFDYYRRCISKSASRHDAAYQFDAYNKAVYFASSYQTFSVSGPG